MDVMYEPVSEDDFTIRLTRDQALVLSDRLDRMEANEQFDRLVNEDRAVWSPILQISGTLDSRWLRSSCLTAPLVLKRPENGSRTLSATLGVHRRPFRPRGAG
ncbi:hypothetical protein GCM10023178_05220 [Actinomadura luteofluorescens]